MSNEVFLKKTSVDRKNMHNETKKAPLVFDFIELDLHDWQQMINLNFSKKVNYSTIPGISVKMDLLNIPFHWQLPWQLKQTFAKMI
ncbi:MAG: hypothetical protein KAQ98_06755 [Bacteriovoracaceae bacterium]|nr:hypothetical protein [Bacteriovoracaceae bacterium]